MNLHPVRTPGAFLAICLLLTLVSCQDYANSAVSGGIFRGNPSRAQALDGYWRFHPGVDFDPQQNKLIKAADLWARENPQFLRVPGVWNKDLPARATGSYQLFIQDLLPGTIYALQFKGISHQGQIWLNNDLAGSWASEGINFIPRAYFFEARSSSVLLTVAVENAYLAGGGLWLPVWLGEATAMETAMHHARFMEIVLLGGVLMMGLYHLMIYFFRLRDKSPLYFGLFCLFSVLKAGFAGEQILALQLPWLSQDLGMRLAYLATIAMPISFLAYMQVIFPVKRDRIFLPLMLILGLVQTAISFLAPLHMVQSWFVPYQVLIVLASVHLIMVMVSAVSRRAKGSSLMLLGFLVLFVAALNDILHDNKIIVTFYAVNLGLFFFLFTQALIMGGLFSLAFTQVQVLNDSLESKVAERTKELETLARHDPLTGLFNRRYFLDLLEREWAGWARDGEDFCLVMVDLDFFKNINDQKGHAAGDEALRQVADLLLTQVRRTDAVARYGGEEFCLLLPGVKLQDARQIMEKIRIQLAAGNTLTLSYGIAQASNHLHPERLIDAADKLMYKAKQGGRNRGVLEGFS